jgi:alcohol dehydrogenase, propanol-preferring
MLKAWILREQAPIEQKPLVLAEYPTPHPGEHEIRIRVEYAGVCRTDIHIAEGDLPLRKDPIILGHEVVGIVDEVGEKTTRFKLGERAGAYWFYDSCGHCPYCQAGRENYCPSFQATGWDADGGFAEYTVVPESSAVSLASQPLEPSRLPPLLCPGIAGYAAFKLTGLTGGESLGLYGFGPTVYYTLKLAQDLNIETYVSTRSARNIEWANREGAMWSGDTSKEQMPVMLDAAILFPPAGNLVEPILSRLKHAGVLVMAPVSCSTIKIADYSSNLWGRSIQTLYQLSGSDGEAFLDKAKGLELSHAVSLFPFDKLDEALILAKHGELDQGNAVIAVRP